MVEHVELPWSDILDYLANVGSARSLPGLYRSILTNIKYLIPYDVNGIFSFIDESGKIICWGLEGESEEQVRSFNQYYWKTVPADSLGLEKAGIIDWDKFRNTEYVMDFLYPQGIRYTTWIARLGKVNGSSGGIAINRSRDARPFTWRELAILESIHPLLDNYIKMLDLANRGFETYPSAEEVRSKFNMLTLREAEIAVLLCKRYDTRMISSHLVISPRTTYKHVENIFAKMKVNNRRKLADKLLS